LTMWLAESKLAAPGTIAKLESEFTELENMLGIVLATGR
jgi:hypothetical protein